MAPILTSLASIIKQYGITGLAAAADSGTISGIIASGGVISDYEVSGTRYRAHVFTSSGHFNVTALSEDASSFPNSIDYLVIGGGGGGGNSDGGGGGAGGYRTSMPEGPGGPSPSAESTITAIVNNYSVTVGGGGAGDATPNGYSNPTQSSRPGAVGGFTGTASVFSTVTSEGGGGGGGYVSGSPAVVNQKGAPGGSGGGAGAFYGSSTDDGIGSKNPSNSPVPNQGYPGGHGNYPGTPNENYGGGGGGGAGGVGGNGQDPSTGGVGGNGKASVISEGPGNPITRAGGGGGGIQDPGGTLGVAGPGGGGTGGKHNTVTATAGTSGTGSGGGGGGTDGGNRPGGAGGSGVVIVRYQIGSSQTGTAKATGGNIFYYNNKTIHVFTGTGTFANPTALNGGSANPLNAEYVVIGGGGGGGKHNGGGGGAGGYTEGPTTIASGSSFLVTIGGGGAPGQSSFPTGPGLPSALWDGTDTTVAFPAGTITGGKGGGGANEGSNAGGTASRNGSSVPLGSGGGAGGPPGNTACGGGGGGAGGDGVDAPGSPNQSSGGGGGLGRQVPSTFRNPKSLVGAPGPTGSVPGTNPGGDTSGTHWVCGGGGGRGAADPTGNTGTYMSGYGGTGVLGSPTVTTSYAGGGRGGFGPNPGDNKSELRGVSGDANTGGGGGAAGGNEGGDGIYGGAGGSGIVLIAYPT